MKKNLILVVLFTIMSYCEAGYFGGSGKVFDPTTINTSITASTSSIVSIGNVPSYQTETFPLGVPVLNWKRDVDGFTIVADSAAIDTKGGQRVMIFSTAALVDCSVQAKLQIMKSWEAIGVGLRSKENTACNELLSYHFYAQSDDASSGMWKVYRVFFASAAPRGSEYTVSLAAAELNDLNFSTGVIMRMEVYDESGGVRLNGYLDDVLKLTYLDTQRRLTSGAVCIGADTWSIGRISEVQIKKAVLLPVFR